MVSNPSMDLESYKGLCTRTREANLEIMNNLVAKIPFIRPADKLLEFLSMSDFYYAPASTVFHDSYCGGLFTHSIRVFRVLVYLNKILEGREKFSPETMFYVAIGHDICKIDFYHPQTKNRKNLETDKWEKYLGYEVRDKFPIGHGEKSTILMMKYVDLKEEEMLAIRWHMGGFDLGVHDKLAAYSFSSACEFTPLVTMLHSADLLSSYILK